MAAVLPASTKALLKDLSSLFVTGVVSGRSLDKLQHFVGLENDVFFAGSHGFDITGPAPPPCGPAGPETKEELNSAGGVACPEESDCSRPSSPSSPSSLGLLRGASSPPGSPISMRHQVAVEFLPRLQLVKQELEAKLADVAGASVEDNRFSLSVHYRNVETDSGRQVIVSCSRARERVFLASKDNYNERIATISSVAFWVFCVIVFQALAFRHGLTRSVVAPRARFYTCYSMLVLWALFSLCCRRWRRPWQACWRRKARG